ncbi:hypothetical protein GCM10011517_16710 [Actibacterium pelagium]|uniref:Uncharacterized protein n=1 Tax=Actibacterium pelagium TaxID=2029103 RepID=A0A917AGV4_9RHOB|nr:hypothetical protein GCM10011517_16710 [Actibacterium pelagium]
MRIGVSAFVWAESISLTSWGNNEAVICSEGAEFRKFGEKGRVFEILKNGNSLQKNA